MWRLKDLLVAIAEAPVESEMRRLATRELADNFNLAWKTGTLLTPAPEDVYKNVISGSVLSQTPLRSPKRFLSEIFRT